MKIAPLAEVKDKFSAFIEACRKSPVVVTKNGKPVAMIISIGDEDELDRLLLMHHPAFERIIEPGYRSVKEDGGVKSKDFWTEMKRRRAKAA